MLYVPNISCRLTTILYLQDVYETAQNPHYINCFQIEFYERTHMPA